MVASKRSVYQAQQNQRVKTEGCRSSYSMGAASLNAATGSNMQGFSPCPGQGLEDLLEQRQVLEPLGSLRQSGIVPPPEDCIGQVVLDWEFLHDLDLHLLKITPEVPLERLVDVGTQELSLSAGQSMEKLVSYSHKTLEGANGLQASLQLDRNAEVHSTKPVENLYLTDKLDPGVYVVGVHNYAQRQLKDHVIGPRDSDLYKTFEDFKKQDPGYQMMDKALKDQAEHSDDPDGPEKAQLMAKINKAMEDGSSLISRNCCQGTDQFGVHYGATIYTYPEETTDPKHPQGASLEELETVFKSEFFSTSDCVFDPEANPTGYNGANILADVRTGDGGLALTNAKAAHVALLRVTREGSKSKLAEVRMLAGRPCAELVRDASGGNSGSMGALRRLRMQGSRGRRAQQQGMEPCPEPDAISNMEPEAEEQLQQQMEVDSHEPLRSHGASSSRPSGSFFGRAMQWFSG